MTPATRTQIDAAISGLSPLEATQFRRFAARLWRTSPVRTHAIDPEDLVLEAMKRVIEGKRRWYPGRDDFSKFFFGCIRSVVSHAIEHELEGNIANPAPDVDGCGNWEDDIPSDLESPETQAIIGERYAYVMNELTARLSTSPKAQEVLVHRTLGHSSDEIMRMLGLSTGQYDVLRKLIDRNVAFIEDQLKGPMRGTYGFVLRVTLDFGITFERSIGLASRCTPDADWHKRLVDLITCAKPDI